MRKFIIAIAAMLLSLITTEVSAQTTTPTRGQVGGHEWVDLGLPSGTKWATCNVGAIKPSMPGQLFAWGETVVKSSYTEANSKFHSNSSIGDIAGTTNDVATVKWGNSWRMPTKGQMSELIDNCDWKYIQLDGRWVVRLTSCINREVIYLPATGMKDGTMHDNPNGCGNYMTSTPGPNNGVYDYHFGAALGEMGVTTRYYGLAVRPVLVK